MFLNTFKVHTSLGGDYFVAFHGCGGRMFAEGNWHIDSDIDEFADIEGRSDKDVPFGRFRTGYIGFLLQLPAFFCHVYCVLKAGPFRDCTSVLFLPDPEIFVQVHQYLLP
jgi:hypothetical protein